MWMNDKFHSAKFDEYCYYVDFGSGATSKKLSHSTTLNFVIIISLQLGGVNALLYKYIYVNNVYEFPFIFWTLM